MKTKTNKARYVASAALIAALYVVLTTISSLMGLSSGVIQVRFSEALTILPAFTPAAIPGLFIGFGRDCPAPARSGKRDASNSRILRP